MKHSHARRQAGQSVGATLPGRNAPFAVTRRQFLKTGGALVVGFSFAGSISEALGQAMRSITEGLQIGGRMARNRRRTAT